MMKRILAAALLVTAMLVSLGTGVASARPTEAPRVSLYGDDIVTPGVQPGCRGVIHVGLKTDPAEPGRVFATYTPGRFSRAGCTMRVWSNWGVQLPGHNWSPTITAGPRGGKPVKKTLYTGRGLQAIGFGVAGPHKSVAVYLIVP